MGRLTTHVLDTSTGKPASGIKIELFSNDKKLATATTNDDGRVDTPMLEGANFVEGSYQLVFHANDYFTQNGGEPSNFLNEVVIRFNVADAGEHYHVPLLLSPYGYATYRGS